MTLSTAAKPERLRKIKRVNQIKFRQSEENYKFYIAFIKNYRYKFSVNALVAEQVDAADLKSVDRKVVGVRLPLGAPFILLVNQAFKLRARAEKLSPLIFLNPSKTSIYIFPSVKIVTGEQNV